MFSYPSSAVEFGSWAVAQEKKSAVLKILLLSAQHFKGPSAGGAEEK